MVFLSGFAGAGKSIMLFAVRGLIEMVFPHPNAVLTLAPIGTAAVKIEGNTIHSKFGFSFQKIGWYSKFVKSETLFMEGFISNVLFAEMDMILRMCFDTRNPFGGISIICFGDLLQIPPINASPNV